MGRSGQSPIAGSGDLSATRAAALRWRSCSARTSCPCVRSCLTRISGSSSTPARSMSQGGRREQNVGSARSRLIRSLWMCSKRGGDSRTEDKAPCAPLFPGGRVPRLPPRTLDRIVKEALTTIDFVGADMSPRVLRNTYARRHLLGGRTNAEVTASLGLVSERTVARVRATIDGGSGGRGK